MLPWFQYTTIHVGSIPIQVWGFFVAMGMMLSIIILQREAKKQSMNAEPLLDLALKMIIYGVIFSRLFHIFFYEPAYFVSNPFEIFAIWHGGLSSFGGLFGAFITFVIAVKKGKIKRDELPMYGNMLSFAALFGWIIGRVGCVMIHDHLGKESNSFLAFNSPEGLRLDMAFIEIVFLLPLATVFLVFKKKKMYYLFTPLLFVYYGALRFVLDFWRADLSFATGDTRFLGLTPGQYFAIVLVVFGAYLIRKKINFTSNN